MSSLSEAVGHRIIVLSLTCVSLSTATILPSPCDGLPAYVRASYSVSFTAIRLPYRLEYSLAAKVIYKGFFISINTDYCRLKNLYQGNCLGHGGNTVQSSFPSRCWSRSPCQGRGFDIDRASHGGCSPPSPRLRGVPGASL